MPEAKLDSEPRVGGEGGAVLALRVYSHGDRVGSPLLGFLCITRLSALDKACASVSSGLSSNTPNTRVHTNPKHLSASASSFLRWKSFEVLISQGSWGESDEFV